MIPNSAKGSSLPSFRKFEQNLLRLLLSFDSIADWADLIAFLSKLIKIIQENGGKSSIPESHLLSKRLSQCLSPTVPAGVHQKALEAYSVLFSAMGSAQLIKEADTWVIGFLPYFAFAPMAVKPQLLKVLEIFFIPIISKLAHLVTPIVMALLGGSEEINDSESFRKDSALLDKILFEVGDSIFFESIWQILAHHDENRAGTLLYLSQRPAAISGKSFSICRGLYPCLEHSSLIIKRATLDLLINRFPLDRAALDFSSQDLRTVMIAVLQTVLRCDMSVNRRVFNWLLGQEHDYFDNHCKRPMRETILFELKSKSIRRIVTTMKVLLSLLDNRDLGVPIFIDVAPSLLGTLLENHKCNFVRPSDELASISKLLFIALDPGVLWTEIYKLMRKKNMEVVHYLIGHIQFINDDLHLPYMMAFTMCLIDTLSACDITNTSGLELLELLLRMLSCIGNAGNCPNLLNISSSVSQVSPEILSIHQVWWQVELFIYTMFKCQYNIAVIRLTQFMCTKNKYPLDIASTFSAISQSKNPIVQRTLILWTLNAPRHKISPYIPIFLKLIFSHLQFGRSSKHPGSVKILWRILHIDGGLCNSLISRHFLFTGRGLQCLGNVIRYSRFTLTSRNLFSKYILQVLSCLKYPRQSTDALKWISHYVETNALIIEHLISSLSLKSGESIKCELPSKDMSGEHIFHLLYVAIRRLIFEIQAEKVQYDGYVCNLLRRVSKVCLGCLEISTDDGFYSMQEFAANCLFELISSLTAPSHVRKECLTKIMIRSKKAAGKTDSLELQRILLKIIGHILSDVGCFCDEEGALSENVLLSSRASIIEVVMLGVIQAKSSTELSVYLTFMETVAPILQLTDPFVKFLLLQFRRNFQMCNSELCISLLNSIFTTVKIMDKGLRQSYTNEPLCIMYELSGNSMHHGVLEVVPSLAQEFLDVLQIINKSSNPCSYWGRLSKIIIRLAKYLASRIPFAWVHAIVLNYFSARHSLETLIEACQQPIPKIYQVCMETVLELHCKGCYIKDKFLQCILDLQGYYPSFYSDSWDVFLRVIEDASNSEHIIPFRLLVCFCNHLSNSAARDNNRLSSCQFWLEKITNRVNSSLNKWIKANETSPELVNYLDVMKEIVVPSIHALVPDSSRTGLYNDVFMKIVEAFLQNPQHEYFSKGLEVLAVLCQVGYTLKWKAAIIEFISNNDFFKTPKSCLALKSILSQFPIDRKVVEGLAELTYESFGNSEKFCRTLRRLSFIFWSDDRDTYGSIVPSILDKTVIISRTSPQYLVNFWPIITCEIMHIIRSTLNDAEHLTSSTLCELCGICKLLRALFHLNLKGFSIYQNIFKERSLLGQLLDFVNVNTSSKELENLKATTEIQQICKEVLDQDENSQLGSGNNGSSIENLLFNDIIQPINF